MEQLYIAAGGAGLLVLLLFFLVVLRRRSSDVAASKRAHEEAQDREPPVEIGEQYEFAITEFTDHHSGEQVAVGKVEGFVLFAGDVPSGAGEGDVVRARVDSFNRGRTSADATVVSTA
ncbi:TRAM domain-containing protein [Salinarchaeum laminariae]|uniref:TRAM domain-containing protein n=1 Tax=Salinarchaeum laminariae TaxID=869888 RepID=UPI0020C178C1|nr:RNA-binding protein [Salinarchaeum laminariae]